MSCSIRYCCKKFTLKHSEDLNNSGPQMSSYKFFCPPSFCLRFSPTKVVSDISGFRLPAQACMYIYFKFKFKSWWTS